MSVTVLRTGPHRDAAASAEPQALAMWRAQPGALMLLGHAAGPLPKAGSARMAALRGMFRAEFWPLGGEAGYAFLAAVRVPHAADRVDGAELILCGSRGADRDFRLALAGSAAAAEFGRQVASMAGAPAARLTHFMLDVMRSDDGGDMQEPRAVLAAFVAHAARTDGCVELIMHVPRRCVLLQGWGARSSEPVELLLPGASVLRHPAASGDFARTDLAAPATGSILALPPDAIDALTGLEKVFLLTGSELICRSVVEPRVLDPEASIGQIRHLLPRLNCPAPMQALLRATLQPQFAGLDTLNGGGRPVRAALDMAVAADGGGAYVSGWVFDPAGESTEVHLCAEGLAARLDESWVRIQRQDVSAAFAADPAFAVPHGHQWGFAVATPIAPPPGQPAYLRFTFADGDLAFVPIRFAPPDAPAVLSRLLASIDVHKTSGLSIVEKHLAPFIAGLPTPSAAPSQILLRGPLDRARTLVVPLCSASLPRSFVSSFLLDPAQATEQIVFICGPEWDHAQLETLVGLIRFYHLPASVVVTGRTPLPADAVREAAAMCQSDSFLLASPGVVGSMPGWREAIHHAAPTGPVACPTVLFEDRSVRFAGTKQVTFVDRAPFASVYAPLAGAYADFAGDTEPTRAGTGTFACCLIRRAALPALAKATRFATEAGQEAAFFLSLRDAGLHATWVPAIRVSAPEEEAAQTTPVTPLIDGWILRQTWGEASSCAF